jgi:hypothetical protein
MQRAPEIVLQEAAKAAQALRDVIESKPNKVVINGKTFLTFEDWQTSAASTESLWQPRDQLHRTRPGARLRMPRGSDSRRWPGHRRRAGDVHG